MITDKHSHILSAGLTIDLASGTVTNEKRGDTRLGPVNLRVLMALLSHPGELVSRRELFDRVWPNQDVNDDVLTRNISDLRAALGNLSTHDVLIDTVPKKGYRWIHTAKTETPAPQQTTINARADRKAELFKLLRWSPLYLLIVSLLLSLVVWVTLTLNEMQVKTHAVAVLPIQTAPKHLEARAQLFREALISQLLQYPEVSVLAQGAMINHKNTYYPSLYNRFGTTWIVEISFRDIDKNHSQTMISLVDARSAYLLTRIRANVNTEDAWAEKEATLQAKALVNAITEYK